jgi:hypothetical protein
MLQHLKLGEVLIQRRLIAPEQLQHILEIQSTYSKQIGELLVERSLISPEDLTTALKEQYWRDHGYWIIE